MPTQILNQQKYTRPPRRFYVTSFLPSCREGYYAAPICKLAERSAQHVMHLHGNDNDIIDESAFKNVIATVAVLSSCLACSGIILLGIKSQIS